MRFLKKTAQSFWPYLLFIAIVSFSYSPTFTGKFILDDNQLIRSNKYIKELHSISSYLAQEDGIWDKRDLGIYHTGYYRPLINITYFLDYKIWGLKAYGFRITNFILHLLSCLIIFKMIDYFIGDRKAAWWCTILFSVHPVNTESLSCVVARNNILVTFFSLLSLYFYIKEVEKPDYVRKILSVIAYFCAVFSKEFGLMILPVIFLYNRLCARSKRSISAEYLSYVPFVIVAIFYFYLRHLVTGNLLTPFDGAQILKRMYFTPYIIAWNLKLIFFPYGLHQYHISYPSSFFNLYAGLSIMLVLSISIFLWVRRNDKIIIFTSLSFLIVIFPVLSIIPSSATPNALVALRWLYFPLPFIVLSFGWILKRYFNPIKVYIRVSLCVVICYFCVYSYILNKYHWQDDESFFKQEVLHFDNILYAGGFAEYLLNQGKFTEAEKYYKIAINMSPNQAYNYINYSAMLITDGKYHDALSYLHKAKNLLMTHHELGEWHNNMGSALLGMGETVEAFKHLKKAVILAPDEAIFWANLGGAYGAMSEYEQSAEALKKGLSIFPELLQLRTNLAMTYINMENYKEAIHMLEQIPRRNGSEDKIVLKLLGVAYDGLNRTSNEKALDNH